MNGVDYIGPSIVDEFAPGPMCVGACDDGHVCEDHPHKPWEHDDCQAAGMPCSRAECGKQ